MLKKLLLAVSVFIATMGFAFAQVDVNKADQAALDSVKGIGPKTSKAIVDERTKNGAFKDWADFEKRVKGIGDKNSDKMSQAGLTVDGKSKPNAPAAKTDAKAAAKSDAKAKADAKSKSEPKNASEGVTAAQSKVDAKASGTTPAMPKAETKADAKAGAAAKDTKKEDARK